MTVEPKLNLVKMGFVERVFAGVLNGVYQGCKHLVFYEVVSILTKG